MDNFNTVAGIKNIGFSFLGNRNKINYSSSLGHKNGKLRNQGVPGTAYGSCLGPKSKFNYKVRLEEIIL
jgi:hypothetical protein